MIKNFAQLESKMTNTQNKPTIVLAGNADELSVEALRLKLAESGVTTYVVARKDHASIDAYDPLTQPGGKYYDLNDPFFDILDSIAHSIAELVRL